MTFVLSFPPYAFTRLGCNLRQNGLENLCTPYLCIGHMQMNTLDHVYGRCILRWHNLTSSCSCLSVREESNKATGLNFSHGGSTLWNSLPYNSRESSSLNQFKRLLYQYFKYTAFMEIRSVGSFVVK